MSLSLVTSPSHSQKSFRRRWSCPDQRTLALLTIQTDFETSDQLLPESIDITFDPDAYEDASISGLKSVFSDDSDGGLSPSLSSSSSSSSSGPSPGPSFHQPIVSITLDDVIHDEDEEGQYLLIPPSNPFYISKRSPGLGCTSSATPSPFTGLSPYAFSCDPALAPISPSLKTPTLELSPMFVDHPETVYQPTEVWMERQFLGYRSPAFQHMSAGPGVGIGDGSPKTTSAATEVAGSSSKFRPHSLLSPNSAYKPHSPLIRVPVMPDVPIDCDEVPE
ncbi:hypothetical protein BDN72DRAFT_838184 [Pluteus cervinus]|uniref:Uncharacterized protein n=1 Tax=Pluteus cervinus TaxID=181527 RepID=A0ACD3AZR2_9AGAR|nr:hypothetical protein BDN72DRAFT_838184 [Pluteus cervinus]